MLVGTIGGITILSILSKDSKRDRTGLACFDCSWPIE